LDLGKTYRFVTELEKLLADSAYSKSKIFHHTSLDSAKRANSGYLMCAFQVIILGRGAEEAWSPFSKIQPGFADFRDASFGTCTYKCTILDCLRGLEYAIKLKWFNVRNFNLRDYEYYEKVENGDLNWIIPGKFVAFSGPSSTQTDAEGWRTFTPEDYVPIFKKFGVTLVIRLNKKQYEKERFTKHGIKHMELYFMDGSCPSDDIIEDFLTTCEKEKGAVAVHCKAGLGRTGSLIAMYTMKHYKFRAPDFIGWIRIARPGSILGPQQQFLCDKEASMHLLSESSSIFTSILPFIQDYLKKEDTLSEDFAKLQVSKNVDMSPEEKKIAKSGDYRQAERLLASKHKNSPSPTDKKDYNYGSSPQKSG
jgi:cell division cycle 14